MRLHRLYQFSSRFSVWVIFLFCLAAFVGCSSSSSQSYKVEFDPNWPSLNLNFKSSNVTGLTLDLLDELAAKENLTIVQINGFENELIRDLKQKRCDAAILFFTPHGYDIQELDVSPIYLETGPVLVTRKGERNTKTMAGKEIAAFNEDDMILLAQKYPQAIYRPHTVVAQALGEVASNLLDGVILPRLVAESYCKDLYQGMLEINSPTLREEGLRMITRKEDRSKLQRMFTKQINGWNKSSASRKALQKWSLE